MVFFVCGIIFHYLWHLVGGGKVRVTERVNGIAFCHFNRRNMTMEVRERFLPKST